MMLAKDAMQKEERLLLEAIGKVRGQKQRPNVERIFAMMQQSCEGLTVDDVARQLESAVRSRKIICFETKGGVSYRDASLLKDNKTELSKHCQSETGGGDSCDLSKLVISSISRSMSGCTLEEIVSFVRKNLPTLNSDKDVLRRQLDVTCRTLVRDKCLVMRDGLYALYEFGKSKSPLRTSSADSADGDDRLSSTTSSSLKKLSSRKSVCLICRRQQDDNGCSALVTCTDCNYAGHASCIKLSPSLARTVRLTQWQCYACKTCSACKGSGSRVKMPADLLICDGCDRGFHVECCKPPMLAQRASAGRWLCSNCSSNTVMVDADPYHYASDGEQSRRSNPTTGDAYRHGSHPKNRKELHSDASEAVVGSSSDVAKSRPRRASGDCAATSSSRQSSESSSPHSDSTHCDNTANKSSASGVPRGLVDALSQYFTPTDKRRSRVSLNALPLHVVVGLDTESDAPMSGRSVDADTTRRDEVVVRSPVAPASRSPLRNWKKARHLPGSYQTVSYCTNSSIAVASPCRQVSDVDAEPTNSFNDRDRLDPGELQGNTSVIDASVSIVSKFVGGKMKEKLDKDSSALLCNMPQSLVRVQRLSGGFSLPYKEQDEKEGIDSKSRKRKSVGSRKVLRNEDVESRGRSSSLSETESDSKRKRFRRTQLSSLQDSLSHFFTADGERKRSARSAEYNFASTMFCDQLTVPSKKIRKNRSLSDSRRSESDQAAERSADTESCSSLFKPSEEGDSLSGSFIETHKHPSVSEPDIQDDDLNVFNSSQSASQVSSTAGELRVSSPLLKSRLINVRFGDHRWNVNISANCIANTSRLQSMFICERCLKIFGSDRSMLRHARKCTIVHQNVGPEIYRSGDLSVYEVDGSLEPSFGLGLSLLISMFGIDSRLTVDTAVCDVTAQACLFYVLVNNSKDKCSMVGFLSKEVNFHHKSCSLRLLVFPEHRGKGFDVFLVELNYKLCQLEGISCSYAQPLSDTTKELLDNFWTRAIIDYLNRQTKKAEITILDISTATGISADDVTATLKNLCLLTGPIIRETVLINWDRIARLSGRERVSYSVRFDPSLLVRLVPRVAASSGVERYLSSSHEEKTLSFANEGQRSFLKQDSKKRETNIQSVPLRRKVGRPKGTFKHVSNKQLLVEKNRGAKRGRGRPPKAKGISQVSHKFVKKQSALVRKAGQISGRRKAKKKPPNKAMPCLAASATKVSYSTEMPTLKRRDQSISDSESEELDRSPSPPTLEQVDLPCVKKDIEEPESQDSSIVEVTDILEPVSRICDKVILEQITVDIDEKVSVDGSLSLDKSDIEDLETANKSNFDSFDEELNVSEEVDSDDDDNSIDGSDHPLKTIQVCDDVFMGNSPSSSSNAINKKDDRSTPCPIVIDGVLSDNEDNESSKKESTKNSSVSDTDDLNLTMTEKIVNDDEHHHSSRASSPVLSSSYESDAGCPLSDEEEDSVKPIEDEASVDGIAKVHLSETDSIDKDVTRKEADESADSDVVDLEFEDQMGSANPVDIEALAESSESGGFPSDFVKKLTSNDVEGMLMPDLGFGNLIKDKDGKGISAGIVNDKNIYEKTSPPAVTTSRSPEALDDNASDSLPGASGIVETSSVVVSETVRRAAVTERTAFDESVDYQPAQIISNEETAESTQFHSVMPSKVSNNKNDSNVMPAASSQACYNAPPPSLVRRAEQITSFREPARSTSYAATAGNERGSTSGHANLGNFLPSANSMNVEHSSKLMPSYVSSEPDPRNAVGVPQPQLNYAAMISSPGRNSSASIGLLHNPVSNVASPGGNNNVVRVSEQNSGLYSATYRNLPGSSQHSIQQQTASPGSNASELAMPSPKNYYMDCNLPRLGGYTGQPTGLSVSDAGYAGARVQSAKESPGSCAETAVASPASSILSPPASSGGRAHFNVAPVTSRSPASRIDQSPTSVPASAYGSILGGSVAPGSRLTNFSRPNPSPSSSSHPQKRNSGGGLSGGNRPNQSPLEVNVFSPPSAVESSPVMRSTSCMAVPPSCATPDVGLSFHFPSNNVVAVPVTATSYASIPSPTPRSLQLLLPSVSSGSSSGSGYQRQGQQHHPSMPQSAVPVHQRSTSSVPYQSQHHQSLSTGLGLLGYGGTHGASSALPQVSYAATHMLDQRFMSGAVPYDQPPDPSPSFPGGRQARNPRSAPTPGQPLARLQQLTNQLSDSELAAHYDMAPYAMSGGPTMSMLLAQGVAPGHGTGLQESFLSGISLNSSGSSVAGQQSAGKSSGRRRAGGGASTASKTNVPQNGGVQAPLAFSPNIAAAAGYNMLGAFQQSQQPHSQQQARPPSRFDYQQYLAANAAAAAAGFFNPGASQLPMQMMHFGMQHPQVAGSVAPSFSQPQPPQRGQGGNPMYPAYGYGSLPSSEQFNNTSGR